MFSYYLITFFGAPIWLGERLKLVAFLGGIVVLAGTLLITVWDTKKPRPLLEDVK